MTNIRRIPLEDFFKKPEKVMVRISPSGKYLSWMEPWKRRLNVHVKNTETGEIKRITHATERDLDGYGWANDERIIYAMDDGGDENTRIYGVNYDGLNPLEFTPYKNVKCDIVDDLEIMVCKEEKGSDSQKIAIKKIKSKFFLNIFVKLISRSATTNIKNCSC